MILNRRIGMVSVVALLAAFLTVIGGAFQPVSAAESAAIVAVPPARLLETRFNETTIDGQFAAIGKRPAGSVTEVKIAGRGNIPTDATAAVLNVTTVLPDADTLLTVYPCDATRPLASNSNTPVNDVRANNVFVKLSPTGTVCIYTVFATDIVVDANGYVPANGTPTSINPSRLLETRSGEVTIDGQSQAIGKRPAKSVTEVKIAGRADIPADATAAVLNVTTVQPDADTLLTVYPCDAKVPLASNSNTPKNDIRANNVWVKLSPSGTVCIYTDAATDIVVDANGYIPATGTPTTITPSRLLETRSGEVTIDGQSQGIGKRPFGSVTEVKVAGRASIPANATAAVLNVTTVQPDADTLLTVYPCDTKLPLASTVNTPTGDIRANSVFVKLSPTGTVCIYTVAATDIVIDANAYVAPPTTPPTPVCTINGVKVTTELPGTECDALTALYNSTNGPNWTNNTGWMASTDPCTWYGIECIEGHVRLLRLFENNLSGSLPAEIGKLTELSDLELDENNITGSLPPEIGNLTNLTRLQLEKNDITGSLPPEIGNLTNLTFLGLSANRLSSLPPEIGNLTNLQTLWINTNRLSALPPEIGNLTNLVALNAGGSDLKALPPEISNLTRLRRLDLEGSPLGSLPPSVTSLVNLEHLGISYTGLTSFPTEITKLTNLYSLYAGGNEFTSIPPEIGDLTNLSSLSLGNSGLTSIPSEIGNLTNLGLLNLSGNSLELIPPEVSNLTNLHTLTLNNNLIDEDVTDTLTPLMNANKLTTLLLNNNKCLSTADTALQTWLDALDPAWSAGCSQMTS